MFMNLTKRSAIILGQYTSYMHLLIIDRTVYMCIIYIKFISYTYTSLLLNSSPHPPPPYTPQKGSKDIEIFLSFSMCVWKRQAEGEIDRQMDWQTYQQAESEGDW